MSTIDRSAVSRALAKAIAYKAVGNNKAARAWGAELIRLLDIAEILAPNAPRLVLLEE